MLLNRTFLTTLFAGTLALKAFPQIPPGAKQIIPAFIQVTQVTPAVGVAGHPIDITYTVTNFGQLGLLTGVVNGRFQGVAVVTPAGGLPQAISIAPKASVSGTVRIRIPKTGTGDLTLVFEKVSGCRSVPGPTGRPLEICNHDVYGRGTVSIQVSADTSQQDLDLDGIPDALEDSLLARYRPYYRFSNDNGEEPDRPTDPIWYIRHSALLKDGEQDSTPVVSNANLQSNPSAILTNAALGSSNFQVQGCKTQYFLNPSNDYRSGFYNGDGTDWPGIVSRGGLGLYGHVARDPDLPNLYQVEYWQFYGFNLANATEVGNHEGDWEGIMVTVDLSAPNQQPLAVTHYVHGKAIRFSSVSQALAKQAPGQNTAGPSYEYATSEIGPHYILHGRNWLQTFDGDLDAHNDADLVKMQDATLELFCDTSNPAYQCTHPVVYVEWGTHASWPTSTWTFKLVPNHNGRSAYRYLTAPPPNLGEVARPRASTPGATIIVDYNGHWGAFSRSLPGFVDTSSPLGPALHSIWARPRNGAPMASCLE